MWKIILELSENFPILFIQIHCLVKFLGRRIYFFLWSRRHHTRPVGKGFGGAEVVVRIQCPICQEEITELAGVNTPDQQIYHCLAESHGFEEVSYFSNSIYHILHILQFSNHIFTWKFPLLGILFYLFFLIFGHSARIQPIQPSSSLSPSPSPSPSSSPSIPGKFSFLNYQTRKIHYFFPIPKYSSSHHEKWRPESSHSTRRMYY